LTKALQSTSFKNSPIIPIAANVGSVDGKEVSTLGLNELMDCIKSYISIPKRNPIGDFLFSVDHWFFFFFFFFLFFSFLFFSL